MGRAEEQARIREVLVALGGSPEAFDCENDRSPKEPVTLGSRIAAYTRLVSGGKARAPTAAEPAASEPSAPLAATPTEAVPKPELVLQSEVSQAAGAPEERRLGRGREAAVVHGRRVIVHVAHAARVLTRLLIHAALALARLLTRAAGVLMRSAVRAVRLFALFVLRAARDLARTVPRATAALTRSLRPLTRRLIHAALALARLLIRAAVVLMHSAVHAVRLLARLVRRAARDLALAVSRATTALTRSLRPVRRRDDRREAGHAAAAVLAWVQPRAEVSDEPSNITLVDQDTYGGSRDTAVKPLEPRSRKYPSGRSRRIPQAGLALLPAVIVIVPVALVLFLHQRDQGVVPQPQRSAVTATAESVASRTAFSDPRAYAGAMTQLALANGRTHLDGKPACGENSTWERWTCRAKGRPTLGPYAGHWLTYRCSPSYEPQPGGRAATLMINCKPENPPPLTT